jgi:hypothetical protein
MPPSKRAASKSPAPASASAPLVNAVLLTGAIVAGLYGLVAHGRLSWPPTALMANAYTLAGYIALVGPIVLARRGTDGESGLGDLLWLTGGALVWIFDLAAVLGGRGSAASFATPIGARTMGLVVLAVLLAGWRTRGAGRSWSWTNVTGWALGAFWVGLALAGLWPSRLASLAAR